MGEFLDNRDGGDIQRVSRITFEGADTAFAQHHVVVPSGHDVFGRKQQLFNGGGNTALQQDGLGNLTKLFKKVVVLHIPRADLQHVHVVEHHRDLGLVHDLGNDQQVVLVRGPAHKFQPLAAAPLKTIRGTAWFEGAPPQHPYPLLRHAGGDGFDLLGVFHAARAGHHHHLFAPDDDVPADLHKGSFRAEMPAGELVRGGNP